MLNAFASLKCSKKMPTSFPGSLILPPPVVSPESGNRMRDPGNKVEKMLEKKKRKHFASSLTGRSPYMEWVTGEISYARDHWLMFFNQPINNSVISKWIFAVEVIFRCSRWRLARRIQVWCLEGQNCRVWRTISLMESQLPRPISRFGLVCILEYPFCILNESRKF